MMTITEATHVARLLHVLDGSATGRDVDQVVESAQYLAGRVSQPLQLRVDLNVDQVRFNGGRLIAAAELTTDLGVSVMTVTLDRAAKVDIYRRGSVRVVVEELGQQYGLLNDEVLRIADTATTTVRPAPPRPQQASHPTPRPPAPPLEPSPDGRYAILDGQHRWATVRDRAFGTTDENPHLACRVHTGLTVTEEASLYHQLNTTRKQLTGWDRWLARRGAADPAVLDIEACAARHNLVIGMQAGGNVLRATKACENVVALGGIPLLDQVFGVVRAAYRDDQAGLDGAILHGLGNVLNAYSSAEYDAARLVDALAGILPRQLTARASSLREVHKGTMDRLAAHVIVDRYNGTKGPKLELFFQRVKPQSKTKTAKVSGAARERKAILEWAERTGYPGRRDRLSPALKQAYAEAHQDVAR